MKKMFPTKLALGLVASLAIAAQSYAANPSPAEIERTVNEIIQPVLKDNDIPGMAIAVTLQGQRYFYNYGVASKESGDKVTQNTIFEIGSVSKTFTAMLASYAQATGALSFNDNANRYLPALAGSHFDNITLLHLGTYTAGGLPLQFPDDVDNQEQMIAYFKQWQPKYKAGTYRQYSNPSLGLFGYLTAQSMQDDYKTLVENVIFAKFGLANTYIVVPQEKMSNYAYGYSKAGKPVRVNPGLLDSEAYGVKSSAEDMIKYVELNINPAGLDKNLQQAVKGTQTGYFSVGPMTQALGWELYPYPIALEQVLQGNSARVSYEANKATELTPPRPPEDNVFINKTGSTNGFGAYVAFVPAKQMGIVMLANKNYPIDVRVRAAYQILTALENEVNQ